MPLNTNKITGGGGSKQAPLESGTYPVRLVQVIDLGLQKQRPFLGNGEAEEKDPQYELNLTYEFLDEFIVDEDGNEDTDKPRWLSEQIPVYSLDSERAKSTQRYYALDPEKDSGGDWTGLVGNPAMINIVQNEGKGKSKGKVYNNIKGLTTMRAKEASKAPDLKNDPKVFDLETPDLTIFKSLPDWLQDKIKENLEYEGSPLQRLLESDESFSGGEVAEKSSKATSKAVSESQDDSDDEDW